VTAEWSRAGTFACYQGSKSFSLNIDAADPAELIEERARGRARQLIASGGSWPPGAVRIDTLRVTRPRPIGL